MTKEEFDKKYVKYDLSIHCPTKELAEEFLELADSFGYEWWCSGSYLSDDGWDEYREDTCYDIYEGARWSLTDARKSDCKILEFEPLAKSSHIK